LRAVRLGREIEERTRVEERAHPTRADPLPLWFLHYASLEQLLTKRPKRQLPQELRVYLAVE
jgi:hypothetical protein